METSNNFTSFYMNDIRPWYLNAYPRSDFLAHVESWPCDSFQSQLRISKTLAFHQFWTNFLTSRESKTFFVKWYGYFYCIKYIYGSEVSSTLPLATILLVKVELHLRKGEKENFVFQNHLAFSKFLGFHHFSHELFGFKWLYNFFINDMTTLNLFQRLYKTMAF